MAYFGVIFQLFVAWLIFQRSKPAALYLISMSVFDILNLSRIINPWYGYWLERSFDLLAMLGVLLALETMAGSVGRRALDILSVLACLLILLAWNSARPRDLAMKLLVIGLGSILVLIGCSLMKNKDLFVLGLVLWPICSLISINHLGWYPLLSVLPLFLWCSMALPRLRKGHLSTIQKTYLIGGPDLDLKRTAEVL